MLWPTRYYPDPTPEPFGPPTEQHAKIIKILDRRMKDAEAAMAVELRRLRKEWYGWDD